MSVLWPASAAAALALVHLLAGRLRFLDTVPRSRWLSAAGGISVAYVFLHLLPELSEAQEVVGDFRLGLLPFLEHHVYLLALVGLAVFYAVERTSHRSRAQRRRIEGLDATRSGVAWFAIGTYAAYNLLIGYLLVHGEDRGRLALALFALAMGVHFVVNDHSLREHHKSAYHRVGRWLCAAAVVAGFFVGVVTEVSEAALALLVSFLAGGIVLNVLKEELPEERESRFGAFAWGAAGYAVLLLAL